MYLLAEQPAMFLASDSRFRLEYKAMLIIFDS